MGQAALGDVTNMFETNPAYADTFSTVVGSYGQYKATVIK